jgi:hypothetical protein
MLVAGEPRQAILRGTELDGALKNGERERPESGVSTAKAEWHAAENPGFR